MIYTYLLVVIGIDLLFNPRQELFPEGWPENFLALLTRYNAEDTNLQEIKTGAREYVKLFKWRIRKKHYQL